MGNVVSVDEEVIDDELEETEIDDHWLGIGWFSCSVQVVGSDHDEAVDGEIGNVGRCALVHHSWCIGSSRWQGDWSVGSDDKDHRSSDLEL